jgi:hypothetical protein
MKIEVLDNVIMCILLFNKYYYVSGKGNGMGESCDVRWELEKCTEVF